MHEVTVLDGAEAHLQGFYNHFMSRSEELALRFDQTVDKGISTLAWSPELAPATEGASDGWC